MNKGFWAQLKKPIYSLAPMADVTDSAFRQMFARYGKPDVMFTEFWSTDALCNATGLRNIMPNLRFEQIERPLVLQVFGANPDNFSRTAELAAELGYDGIDINMGCPEKNIQKQGSCAALIKNPALAKKIIRAAQKGPLPVSVKTRTGYNKNIIEEWTRHLLEAEPVAITVHGRTRKEMSDVPADWNSIAVSKHIALDEGADTMIFGNGDVQSLEDADEKVRLCGVDGVMIGRGAFGNPWFFNRSIKRDDLPLAECFRVMIEHVELFEKLFGPHVGPEKIDKKTNELHWYKNFNIMKKHFKAYVNGFDGAKELRVKLMEAANVKEIKTAVDTFLAVNT